MSQRIATQLRLDETLHAKTKAIAEYEVRTLNAQIEYFIKKGVEAYEAEHTLKNIILVDEDE